MLSLLSVLTHKQQVQLTSASSGGVGSAGVNHVAHLAGALCGVALMVLLSRLAPPAGEQLGSGE